MGNILVKINAFTSQDWSSDIDLALANDIHKNKFNLRDNPSGAGQFIKDYIKMNNNLILQASNEFQRGIEELSLNEEYHGVWEQTALEVVDARGRKIEPELAQEIKKIGKEYFSTFIRDNDEPKKKGFSMIVPKMDLSKISKFEAWIKDISIKGAKDLKVSVYSYPAAEKRFNLANKVNQEMGLGESVDVSVNESAEIRNLYETVTGMLNYEGYNYESNSLLSFIKRKEDKVKAICENYDSSMDVHRLYALMECDTADMDVPEVAVSSTKVKKRVEDYDPYKWASNVQKGSKTVVQFDGDVLQESVSQMHLPEMYVIGHDLETSTKYSRVIVECRANKMELVIDRNDFVSFVKENCLIENYIGESGFDFLRYIDSRPVDMVNGIFREYFATQDRAIVQPNKQKTIITESSSDYNEWKALVATDSMNEFALSRKGAVQEARDSKGKLIGEWNSRELKGLLYK